MSTTDLITLHHQNLNYLEETEGAILVLSTDYPHGYHIPFHQHSRGQLLHARRGVVNVGTEQGRWIVPPEHALWIPAGVRHFVEMRGEVNMRSLYVVPNAIAGLPTGLRVVGLTDLMRSLLQEAALLTQHLSPTPRDKLILALLLEEIPRLPERPLGLPFPAEPRLVALCERFLETPSPHTTIDDWAEILAMSRRTFTRTFQRETGLSFAVWRQQACLFAALPRLASGEPVTDIALDLGYQSVAAFTTMFKRMLGSTPRQNASAYGPTLSR